jgi:hypothetical protein
MPETHTSSTGGAQEKSGGFVNLVKESATAQLTNQKNRGTDALGRVAEAVRSSTQKLRDEQHDTIANYVDQAADQIETWSRRLQQKDVNELLADVQRLARRKPTVFIGSAFALGLVAARFLKSSRRSAEYGRAYERGHESPRRTYGGATAPGSVHDYAGAGREDEVPVASEVMITEIEVEPDIEGSTPTGSEGRTRSTRGRRSSARSE